MAVLLLPVIHLGGVGVRTHTYDGRIEACLTEGGHTKPAAGEGKELTVGDQQVNVAELAYDFFIVACDEKLGGGPGFWRLP